MDLSCSLYTGVGDAPPLEDVAAWAAAHEFDAIRLSARGDCDPDRILTEGPDRVLDTLKRHGLYLAALSGHQPLLHADPEERERAQRQLIRNIDTAAALGTPVVVTATGTPCSWLFYGLPAPRSVGHTYHANPPSQTSRVEEVLGMFREMFTPVVRHAEEKGVKIALDCAVRMGNIAVNPEMWERVLDAIPSDALGLSFDPSHLLWLQISPVEEAVRMFKGKWYYADVKDAEIRPQMLFRQGIIGNCWWEYRVPGRGQLNWGTIIGALHYADYDYVLCVENEDADCPGLAGLDLGRRHLAQFLAK